MKAKEILELQELYEEFGYKCFCCGKQATQRAHIIGNTKANRKKYGDAVIDSKYNWLPVCGLECNALVDVGKLSKTADRIAVEIKSKSHKKRLWITLMVKNNIRRKQDKEGK